MVRDDNFSAGGIVGTGEGTWVGAIVGTGEGACVGGIVGIGEGTWDGTGEADGSVAVVQETNNKGITTNPNKR
jgi:hypothetical protein